MKKLNFSQKTNLLIGYAISGFGDQFYTFAIPLLMLTRSHSSLIMGLLTAMEYLPTVVFGLLIGSIFDVYSRKRVMLTSLIAQIILILLVPLFVIKDVPIWTILIAIFILGTFDLMSWTGYQIFIAESVSSNELPQVSGEVGLISSIQKTFGPGIAAIVINLINYVGGFILDAISFVYLAFTIRGYKPLSTKTNNEKHTLKAGTKDGLRFLLSNHDLKWLIISFLAANIGFQVVVPMLTFLLKQNMHVSIGMISLFFTISSVASILGNFCYLKLGKKIDVGLQLLLIGLLITVGFSVMFFMKQFILFAMGYAIVSFGSVWAQANFFTIMQAKTPNKYKGMVTSTSTSLTRITGPIMAVLGGILVKYNPLLILIVAVMCLVVSVIVTVGSGLLKLKQC